MNSTTTTASISSQPSKITKRSLSNKRQGVPSMNAQWIA